MKLLYIGFDAWDGQRVINKQLLARWGGTVCICKPEEALSAPSWTSLYTGLPVDAHGVRSVWGLQSEDTPFAQVPPCTWDYLNAAGAKCGVIGMPATWPARPLDGWMVSGPFGPSLDKRALYPADLALFTGYQLSYIAAMPVGKRMGELWQDPHTPERAWEIMERIAWGRLSQAAQLVEQHPVEALFVGFSFPDLWGHKSRKHGDESQARHDRVDTLALRLVNAIEAFWSADVVVIVSDHGFAVDHTMHGVFALKQNTGGNGKAKPVNPGAVKTCEVNGIVLSALGLSAEQIARTRDKQTAPRGHVDNGLTEAEEAAVLHRLEALGYV